jgi:hypothetical protein
MIHSLNCRCEACESERLAKAARLNVNQVIAHLEKIGESLRPLEMTPEEAASVRAALSQVASKIEVAAAE